MSANELTPEQYEMLYGEAPPAALEWATIEEPPKKLRRWWPSFLLVAGIAVTVIIVANVLRGDGAPLDTTEKAVTEVPEESVIVSEGLDTIPATSSTTVADTTTRKAETGQATIADAAVAEPATAPTTNTVADGETSTTIEASATDADTTTAVATSEVTPTTAQTTTTQETDNDPGTVTITCLDGSEIRGVVADAYASLDEAKQELCGSPESEQWRLDLAAAGFGDDAEPYSSEQIDAFSQRTCELMEGDAGAAWLAAATELNLPGAAGLPPPVQEVFGEASISAYCPQ